MQFLFERPTIHEDTNKCVRCCLQVQQESKDNVFLQKQRNVLELQKKKSKENRLWKLLEVQLAFNKGHVCTCEQLEV